MDLESFLLKKKRKRRHKKGVSPSPTPNPRRKHKKDPTSAGEAVGQCPACFVVARHAPFAVTISDSANSARLPLLLVRFWPVIQLL